MMYVCVLDFEATCCENDELFKKCEMEIIEFPSILLKLQNDDIQHISTFHEYVRPVMHPQLGDFCKNLTKIKQETVDKADILENVYARHYKWLMENIQDNDVFFVTGGEWDLRIQLPRECKIKNITVHDVYKKFLDIKDPYEDIHPNGNCGMMGMLEKLGIPHVGVHHSGIDDSRNISNIFIHIMKKHPNFILKHIKDLKPVKKVKKGTNTHNANNYGNKKQE
jgi:inhibitor of KinA sporulation pathway (predicted exonuclease)